MVVDETYHEFCGYTLIPLLEEYPNLIVLRTFSKWAGLAGLRIGLGIMDPNLARVMMGMKSPYNVNVAAEAALTASLEDRDELLRRVECIVQERERLFAKLQALPGVTPWSSQANFILTQLPRGRGKELFEGLARRGIFVRYFGGERLEDFVRISVGLPHQTDAVISALGEPAVIAGWERSPVTLREATLERQTSETQISLTLCLDGQGIPQVATGNGMLDHMVRQLSRHGLIDITLSAHGDVEVGWHHLVEDTAITLGRAFHQALGDGRGITAHGTRYRSVG